MINLANPVLTEAVAQQCNDLAVLSQFKKAWAFNKFLRLPHRVIGLFTGNRYGKTHGVIYQYIIRMLGDHPIAKRNILYFECKNGHIVVPRIGKLDQFPRDRMCPKCGELLEPHHRISRTIRLCSETLPTDKRGDGTEDVSKESKNTIYPALRRWLPQMFIKDDITLRSFSIVCKDPFTGQVFGEDDTELRWPGQDITFELVSYSQSVQSTAGVNRLAIFFDEEPPKDFYEEQFPRVLADDGDIIIALTPASRITWTHDEIYDRAQVIVRTPVVRNYYKTAMGMEYEVVERTDSPHSIAVLQAATDDNPTLTPKSIEGIFDVFDDPDVISIRRYGIFKQVSGRIFKDFAYDVHVIDPAIWFPNGQMYHGDGWRHVRLIDYHEHNPWAVVWASISPENEVHVWQDWAPNPESNVTRSISEKIAWMSGDYKFSMNLIDPLASKTQTNTGTSVIDDLNTYFGQLKHENIGTGGHWEGWDTKSTRGRDAIRERLKGSVLCKTPYNNKVPRTETNQHLFGDRQFAFVPTLWIWKDCKEMARSLKNWRLEEWANTRVATTKERKEIPSQKFSHFCTALECVFKDVRFRPGRPEGAHSPAPPTYFRRAS